MQGLPEDAKPVVRESPRLGQRARLERSSRRNCVPAEILVLAGIAGAGKLRLAPPAGTRISLSLSARLKRVGNTAHL